MLVNLNTGRRENHLNRLLVDWRWQMLTPGYSMIKRAGT
jgi:hypothetical protein